VVITPAGVRTVKCMCSHLFPNVCWHGSNGRAKHLRRLCARAYLNYFFWIWQQQLPVASFIFVHAIFWCLSQVLVLLSSPLNVLNQSLGPHLHTAGNSRIWMSNNSVTVFFECQTDFDRLLHITPFQITPRWWMKSGNWWISRIWRQLNRIESVWHPISRILSRRCVVVYDEEMHSRVMIEEWAPVTSAKRSRE